MALDTVEKLDLLGQEARFDLACACGGGTPRQRGVDGRWIYPVALPDGKRLPLLKVLLHNNCERNCGYCAQCSNRPIQRAGFMPEELARVFDDLHKAGRVQGLFLSSAVSGNVRTTMDRMLKTVEIVRRKHAFHGFIHLKILPGAEHAQIEKAIRIANRVSVNVEAPNQDALSKIAPRKDFQIEIYQRIHWITDLLRHENVCCKGQTTQFVVGAAGESDREILQLTTRLYQDEGLKRAYFSAFQPIPDTPLENLPPASLVREHRLYQSDFLMRKYGFRFEDIPFGEDGSLSLAQDPKMMWADRHPETFPVEVNTAPPELLLRVPGIGPLGMKMVLHARSGARISSLEMLRKILPGARKAAPYLLLNGRRETDETSEMTAPVQLALW